MTGQYIHSAYHNRGISYEERQSAALVMDPKYKLTTSFLADYLAQPRNIYVIENASVATIDLSQITITTN